MPQEKISDLRDCLDYLLENEQEHYEEGDGNGNKEEGHIYCIALRVDEWFNEKYSQCDGCKKFIDSDSEVFYPFTDIVENARKAGNYSDYDDVNDLPFCEDCSTGENLHKLLKEYRATN